MLCGCSVSFVSEEDENCYLAGQMLVAPGGREFCKEVPSAVLSRALSPSQQLALSGGHHPPAHITPQMTARSND